MQFADPETAYGVRRLKTVEEVLARSRLVVRKQRERDFLQIRIKREAKNRAWTAAADAAAKAVLFAEMEEAWEREFSNKPQAELTGAPPRRTVPVTPADKIINATCRYFHITCDDIFSCRRGDKISYPRQIAMYLVKEATKRTLPEIGRKFSRDHTTVLHAIRKIGGLLGVNDEPTVADVSALKAILKHAGVEFKQPGEP